MSLKVLYPGQFLLWRDGAIISRDNDEAVMNIRFQYQAGRLKPGQRLTLTSVDTGEVKKDLTGVAPSATLPQ